MTATRATTITTCCLVLPPPVVMRCGALATPHQGAELALSVNYKTPVPIVNKAYKYLLSACLMWCFFRPFCCCFYVWFTFLLCFFSILGSCFICSVCFLFSYSWFLFYPFGLLYFLVFVVFFRYSCRVLFPFLCLFLSFPSEIYFLLYFRFISLHFLPVSSLSLLLCSLVHLRFAILLFCYLPPPLFNPFLLSSLPSFITSFYSLVAILYNGSLKVVGCFLIFFLPHLPLSAFFSIYSFAFFIHRFFVNISSLRLFATFLSPRSFLIYFPP